MLFEQPWAQKRMFRAFEKAIFQFFASFWVTRLKLFSGKVEQSIQDYLDQTFGHSELMRKSFWATWSPKTNVMSVWKKHFSDFCKFLTDKVVTMIWQIEAKRSKPFNSNFCHRNLLRKYFCSYLELKSECSKLLEKAFFSFFQVFDWRSWNHFLEKWGKAFKTILIKITAWEPS